MTTPKPARLDLSRYEGATPGPWHVNETRLSGVIARWHVASKKYGSAYPVCEHTIEQEPSGSEQMINAALIADVHTLLAEVRRLYASEDAKDARIAELERALDRIAICMEDHHLYLGDDATGQDLIDTGGDAAVITAAAFEARAALNANGGAQG